MKPLPAIARHRQQAPDPLGFDALRLQAITAAQQASGELWTDYNLHDPGVSLLEALCFALTEDLFAARHPVQQLLGLGPQDGAAAWARFGLHTPQALLPCHPCTAADWETWLLQQLPHARQLSMRPQGRTGLWCLALQSPTDAAEDRQALRAKALQAYWPERNLGEDLAGAPRMLRSRWVALTVSLQVEGHRDVCELLVELLQRCDDCISARLREGLPPRAGASPDVEGPLGRALTAGEQAWLAQDPDLLFVSDLARELQGIEGLVAIDSLLLNLAPGEPDEPEDEIAPPPGSVRRRGGNWALRLRWPDSDDQLSGWQLKRDGVAAPIPKKALLQMLQDRRRLPLRIASGSATQRTPPLPPTEALPPLPALRSDPYYAASAALPPLYTQALLDQARHRPGLRAQWQGYLGLLEQGLNQVQVQREQLPHLYALDEDTTRSCWASLPGDRQLPGIDALYRRPRARLDTAPWVDEDALSRRHRALNYQLALHGESLDHAGLQGLPCYYTPQAWPVHLLRLKRQFARRLLRLGRHRGVGADTSRPLLGEPDNTPPLQERIGLMLGLAQTHSRLLSASWRAHGLPAPAEWPAPSPDPAAARATAAGGEGNARFVLAPPRAVPLPLNPSGPRAATAWPALRQAMPVLRDGLPAPLLRAAVQADLFQWSSAAGGQLWLGPDDAGRHWLAAHGVSEAQALGHARALHAAACQLNAAGEGLHLVEHLLLRPWGTAPAEAASFDAAAAQISLVFSGWTARGADPRFRKLAEQIVQREAPAHLRCRLVWLSAGQMQAFEAAWQAWLAARQAHCAALLDAGRTEGTDGTDSTGGEAAAVAQLDACAARLRAWLQEVTP